MFECVRLDIHTLNLMSYKPYEPQILQLKAKQVNVIMSYCYNNNTAMTAHPWPQISNASHYNEPTKNNRLPRCLNTQQMVHTCFFQCTLIELYVENSWDTGTVAETEYRLPLVQLNTKIEITLPSLYNKHTLVIEYIFCFPLKFQLWFLSHQPCTVVGEMV